VESLNNFFWNDTEYCKLFSQYSVVSQMLQALYY